jgi:hypothetical protein
MAGPYILMGRKEVVKEYIAQWERIEQDLVGTGSSHRFAHEKIAKEYGLSRSTVRRYLVPGERGAGC